jgi:predicted acylesterase/phospholipase RssA
MQLFSRMVAVAFALFILDGCATRPLEATGDLKLALAAKVRTADAAGVPLTHGAPVLRAIGSRHSVLVLSGGGSDGAFGAGVLTGWTALGTRPEFDVVTGVSTGALMATLAFLGPNYDPQLRDFYTQSTNKDIYKSRGAFGLLKGSMYNRAPLELAIAHAITEEVLDKVAAEHARGRRLYVATTNLDRGLQVAWDMGRIASSKSPGRLELYRSILAASAAIPGVFEPVYIKSIDESPALHVDGGVKSAVLFQSFMIGDQSTNKQVWTIVNSRIGHARTDGLSGANAHKLIGRSISEMMRAVMENTVYRTYVRARASGAAFHLSFIPDDVDETDPIEFKPAEMQRLYDAGVSWVKADRWTAEPPRLERFDRAH